MCGIVGIMHLDGSVVVADELRAMNARLTHRGPNDEGYYMGRSIALGMRRLSVIDVSGGAQPIFNEDKSVVTVFNGEIYNFDSIRSRLVGSGHTFRTLSDTETIPHLYEEHGPDFLHELIGMFAIAVWDSDRELLILARDRMGIKPLYYAESCGRLLFASELKAIECILPEIPSPSPYALSLYMHYGYIPAPFTIFENVFKLQPGYRLTGSSHTGVKVEQYWDVSHTNGAVTNENSLTDELHDLLRDAVRLRMISDVPVGAFLSGGVDSSLIVALMREFSGNVRTFSIGFEERGFDESSHARKVARRLGTRHEEFVVRPEIADLLVPIAMQFDEPFADVSAIPTYYLSQLTSQHVTVALSGDGGDELLAGYHRYRNYFRKRLLYRLPRLFRNAIRMLGDALPAGTRGKRFCKTLTMDPFEDYLIGHHTVSPHSLIHSELESSAASAHTVAFAMAYLQRNLPSELDALCYHDMKLYLPEDVLTKVDRMSMATSLEVRVPMLDHRIVQFCANLPASMRLRRSEGKYLLRRVLDRYLPAELFQRKKQGFGVPIGEWFRAGLKEALLDYMSPSCLSRNGLLHGGSAQELVRDHLNGSHDYASLLWRMLVLQIWSEHRGSLDSRLSWSRNLAGTSQVRESALEVRA